MDFIFPPRAEMAVDLPFLNVYEKQGWWGQIKKNGTCSVICIHSNGDITAKNRHGEYHKAWQFTEKSKESFRIFIQYAPVIIVAELMNNKVPGIRDINYVHDILMIKGQILQKNYAIRYGLLDKIYSKYASESFTDSHMIIDDNTWFAKIIKENIVNIAYNLTKPEDEGIVMKNPSIIWNAKNDFWSVKWRKKTKNYSK